MAPQRQTFGPPQNQPHLPPELMHQIVLEVLFDYFDELYTIWERFPNAVIHSDGSIWTNRLTTVSPIQPMLGTSRQLRDITTEWLNKLVGERGLPPPTSQQFLWRHISPVLAHIKILQVENGIVSSIATPDSGGYYDSKLFYASSEEWEETNFNDDISDDGGGDDDGNDDDEDEEQDADIDHQSQTFDDCLYPVLPGPYLYDQGLIRYTITSPLHRFYTYRARIFNLKRVNTISESYPGRDMALYERINMLKEDALSGGDLLFAHQPAILRERFRTRWAAIVWSGLQACYLGQCRTKISMALRGIGSEVKASTSRNVNPDEHVMEEFVCQLCEGLEIFHPYNTNQEQIDFKNVLRKRFGDFSEDVDGTTFTQLWVDQLLKQVPPLDQCLSKEQFARCETLTRKAYYYWSLQGPAIAKKLLTSIHDNFADADDQSSDDVYYDDSDSEQELNSRQHQVPVISFYDYR